jgi:hypothetical protein
MNDEYNFMALILGPLTRQQLVLILRRSLINGLEKAHNLGHYEHNIV